MSRWAARRSRQAAQRTDQSKPRLTTQSRAGEYRRPELEQRRPLAGHVLGPVPSAIRSSSARPAPSRRAGGPARRSRTAPSRRGPPRHDQLVHRRLLQHVRQRVGSPSTGRPGSVRRNDRALERVFDPATTRAERAPRVEQVLPLPTRTARLRTPATRGGRRGSRPRSSRAGTRSRSSSSQRPWGRGRTCRTRAPSRRRTPRSTGPRGRATAGSGRSRHAPRGSHTGLPARTRAG